MKEYIYIIVDPTTKLLLNKQAYESRLSAKKSRDYLYPRGEVWELQVMQ